MTAGEEIRSMPDNNVITIENLTKKFENQVVLDTINLAVNRGIITGIIGKSGAGKSLILKHIMGLIAPDSGSIFVDGIDVTRARKGKINKLRSRMGYLFQNSALFDSMTVFENVALPLRENSSLNKHKILLRVLEQLSFLDLDRSVDKYPPELSGGMKKRVSLARALVTRPNIVLFDEPTTGLDPVRKNDVHNLILETQRLYSYSALIVSHEIPEIFDVADRVAMIHDARIVMEGTSGDFYRTTGPRCA